MKPDDWSRRFEWDEAKAARNLAKHRVSFDYAIRVFVDPAAVDLDASRPDEAESRRKAIGRIEDHTFTVIYTMRGDVIRLISARRCNAREGRLYGCG